MEIFSGFVLMMFMSGDVKPTEFTPRETLGECLKVKRIIRRNQGANGPRWVCKQGKLQIERVGDDIHPIKILEIE